MAISILYNPQPMRLFEADGDVAAGALCHFYLARTTTPLIAYVDSPLTTALPWPVVADGYGILPPCYLAKGTEYKVRIEDAHGNVLYAADGIDNPAAPSGGEGGGGGLVVTTEQIAQTGDMVWNASAANRDGWLRCNGTQIARLGSSVADALKSDAYDALYTYLWNNFSDTLCPVSTGRGTTPALDWSNGKAIALLDMRGYGIAGLDQMGAAAAANRIQVTTTITTTNTSALATVPSTVALCAGMFVQAAGVPTGTTITSVNSATSITLSAAATATASAVPVRFSMFSDALVAGSGGGESAHTLSVAELAVHRHANSAESTVVEPAGGAGHSHNVLNSSAASPTLFVGRETPENGANFDLTGGTPDSKTVTAFTDMNVSGVSVTTTMTNVDAGSGTPMNLWTPTRLGTWLVKI